MSFNVIPYGRQNITDEDIGEVIKTLKSDYLTQGPQIEIFEKNFAKYVGSKFAVAVSNGTCALHLSTIALKLEEGQKVITTPITFAATANAVRYCGGEVVFADIDPKSYLIDTDHVRSILENSTPGEYVGIIPVDFAGRAVNLQHINALAKEFDLWVVEDACHAPGGFFVDDQGKKQNCGNGFFADLSIFSLHPVKHIAAGEGGMITTNDAKLYHKLLELRTHGITRDIGAFTNSIDLAAAGETHADLWPGWYMEMQELGFNYRLTDFQAALGNSQLKRAENGVDKRRAIAKRYTEAFSKVAQITGLSGVVEGHAYHLFVVEVEDRLRLYNHLRENRILAQVHYIPTHLMPYYQQFGWKKGDMPHAEAYYSKCLSLPMYPSLTEDEISYVIEKVIQFYDQ